MYPRKNLSPTNRTRFPPLATNTTSFWPDVVARDAAASETPLFYLTSISPPIPSPINLVWDVTSSTVVASLPKENYVKIDKGGSIVTWNTNSWKRIRSKHVVCAPISSFNVSADGKFLAIGTAEGDISIIDASSMKVQTMVKKVHLGIVSALAFSCDSRALVSSSMDSSVSITLVEDKKKSGGLNLWIIIFFILLAMASYILKYKGIIP